MKTHFALVCLILIATVSTYAQDSRYSFKETFDLGSPAQVSVSCSDGEIEVVAMEGKKRTCFLSWKSTIRYLPSAGKSWKRNL